jgi:hypothetical protein
MHFLLLALVKIALKYFTIYFSMFCALTCSFLYFLISRFFRIRIRFFLLLSLVLTSLDSRHTFLPSLFSILFCNLCRFSDIEDIFAIVLIFLLMCHTENLLANLFPDTKKSPSFSAHEWNFFVSFFRLKKSFLYFLSASETRGTEERLNHVFRWAKDVKSKISLMSRTFTTASRFMLLNFYFLFPEKMILWVAHTKWK